MKEIAAYLKANPNKNLFIVVHTDNVGEFSSNMTLSENRAKVVMNELVTKYGVDTNQLKAYGDAIFHRLQVIQQIKVRLEIVALK